VCGYIAGFADFLANAAGEEPGGSLSQTIALRVFETTFGNSARERLMHETWEWMHSGSTTLTQGMLIGAADANALMEKQIPTELHTYLSSS